MLSWQLAMAKKKAKSSGMSRTHGLILGDITDISESKEVSTCAVLLNAHHLLLFNLTLNYKLSKSRFSLDPGVSLPESTVVWALESGVWRLWTFKNCLVWLSNKTYSVTYLSLYLFYLFVCSIDNSLRCKQQVHHQTYVLNSSSDIARGSLTARQYLRTVISGRTWLELNR